MQKWRYFIIFYVSICINCSILTESLSVGFIIHNLDVSVILIFHLLSPFSDHVFFFFCEPQGMASYRRQNMLSVNMCIFLILSLKSCINLNKPCGFCYPVRNSITSVYWLISTEPSINTSHIVVFNNSKLLFLTVAFNTNYIFVFVLLCIKFG